MREIFYGRAGTPAGPFDYYLLEEPFPQTACAGYGVRISGPGGESGAVRGVTVSQTAAAELMALLLRCQVTPATLRDVLEDLLA